MSDTTQHDETGLAREGPWDRRLAAVGLVVAASAMLGWWLQSPKLVQVSPQLVPMQFNTALGIALCALALMLRRSVLAALCSAAAFTLATLSFLQYVGGWDFGIDTLFVTPWTMVRSSHAGRMAPHTAMAMALTSGALLTLQLRDRRLLASILGTMVMCLGGVALVGYLAGFSPAYRWGHLTDMALHTSFCWLVLGLATIHAAIGGRRLLPDASVREPAVAGMLCAGAFVAHSLALSVVIGGQDASLQALLRSQNELARTRLDTALLTADDDPRTPAALERTLEQVEDGLMPGLLVRLDAPEGPLFSSRTQDRLASSEWSQALRVDGPTGPAMLSVQPTQRWLDAMRPRTGEGLLMIGAATAVLCALFSRKWVAVLHATRRADQTAEALRKEAARHRESRDQLALSNERLREHEERLDLALRAGEIGSWEWDVAAGTLSIDPRLERILEVDARLLDGPASLWSGLLHPASRAPLREAVRAASNGRPPASLDFRVITPSGQARDLTARGVALGDDPEKPERFVGVCIDISRRLKIERELERSNSDLEEFAYAASHDLQEPLRMITSFCEVVEERYHDKIDADGQRFLGYAVEGAHRMQRLVAELLALARVGRSEQPRELVDLAETCRTVVTELDDLAKERDGTVHLGPLPVVFGSPTELERLLRNLVANALRYGGPSPRVELGGEMRGTEQVLWVRDNGPGIDPRYHSRIFRAFKRLGERADTGSGIGLALCRKIVDHHEGRIWVESELGKGATFYVALPVLPSQHLGEPAPTPDPVSA